MNPWLMNESMLVYGHDYAHNNMLHSLLREIHSKMVLPKTFKKGFAKKKRTGQKNSPDHV